jgi:hypothetical protein
MLFVDLVFACTNSVPTASYARYCRSLRDSIIYTTAEVVASFSVSTQASACYVYTQHYLTVVTCDAS